MEVLVIIVLAVAVVIAVAIGDTSKPMKKSHTCSTCGNNFQIERNKVLISQGQPMGIGDDGATEWYRCPSCNEYNCI